MPLLISLSAQRSKQTWSLFEDGWTDGRMNYALREAWGQDTQNLGEGNIFLLPTG